jgi:hypothetical protein
MFRKGELVVCVNTKTLIISKNKVIEPVYKIKEFGIYTIKNPDGGSNDVLLEGNDVYYHESRFISLVEFRKQKLEKIKERINENR